MSVSNRFDKLAPHLVQEWDFTKNSLTPDQVSYSSNKRVWWKCSKGPDHEWTTSINARTGSGTGCPCCRNLTHFSKVESMVSTHLPKENLAALQTLPELALAVKYAALQVEQEIPSESEVSQKLVLGWSLRNVLLPVAKGLAATGFLSVEQVAVIATGRGARDMAEDNVQLSKLFITNAAAIAGKHAVTKEQIEQAALVGTFLVQHLRTKHAPTEKAPEPTAIIDDRNRLATLLVQRYERLQAVAHYLTGPDWEDHVPALMSRTVKRANPENV